MKISARDAAWMGVGAGLLLVLGGLVVFFGAEPGPDARLVSAGRRIALVEDMRRGLASASELEKSAVMALDEAASRSFADQARAAMDEVERGRAELAQRLDAEGTEDERSLLARFSDRFAALRRIDAELLDLAMQDTNLRAAALAGGPALDALDQMGRALDRLVAANADGPQSQRVAALGYGAQIAALRIQAALPEHIAEPTDARMDEMERRMDALAATVQADLDALRAMPRLAAGADLADAAGRWDGFLAAKREILALSRENSNVRSLAIALDEQRKAAQSCDVALAELGKAIADEPIGATSDRWLQIR